MSTTHSDQTPQTAAVEWRAAPHVTADQGAVPPPPAAAPKKLNAKVLAGVAALLVAVGGTTGYLVSHASSGSGTSSASAQQGTPGGTAGGAGDLGFQPTQYHLDGTITAVGNGTVTIKTSAGATTTYTVTSSTHLMNDGSSVALSSFTVGQTVRASTTTQGGTTLNDMVAGDLGTGGARTGTPPQGSTGAAPQSTTGTTG
jgi:hypothetical protein